MQPVLQEPTNQRLPTSGADATPASSSHLPNKRKRSNRLAKAAFWRNFEVATGPWWAPEREQNENITKTDPRDFNTFWPTPGCSTEAQDAVTPGCAMCGRKEKDDPLASRKIRRAIFGNFRPPRALTGPRDRQKSTRDEKQALGKLSGHPETPWDRASKKLERADVWVLRCHLL